MVLFKELIVIDPIIVKLDIDWNALRKQKSALLELVDKHPELEGLLGLIDAVQDQAVDDNGLNEKLVFGEVYDDKQGNI
jgi:hypothetical protein